MTDNNLISSDQIEGYPHPKVTETLFGHQFAELEFMNCFKSGKLHHGWLITGPKGIGKATFAWRLAKFLLTQPIDPVKNELFDISDKSQKSEIDENHKKAITARILAGSEPRLAIIRKSFDEKRKTFREIIRVDEVRQLKTFFSLSVSDGGSRVAIIDCADDMNINAANALLKTLEEPPESVIIILLSEIIPKNQVTIASRCQQVQFNQISDSKMSDWLTPHVNDSQNIQLLTTAARGDIDRAKDLISDPNIAYRYELWKSTLEDLKPDGYAIATSVNEIQKAIDNAQEILAEKHDREIKDLLDNEKQLGIKTGVRSQLEANHKREIRRFRTDELEFGFSIFATMFQEKIRLNPDEGSLRAVNIIKKANGVMKRNANEKLLLTSLLISLSELS